MNKSNAPLFIKFSIVAAVIGIVYSYRWIFSQTFVPTYFQEFYDHSQWSIPQSPRIMGDGELYQYAGYKLLLGDNPFTVNPEVPPIGKYLNAAAISLFHNAFIFNVPIYLLVLFLLFRLTEILKCSKQEGLLAVLLLATSPLLFSQLGDTALDLFHVVTLLLCMVGLLELAKSPSKNFPLKAIFTTGIGLGLFVGTKFGLFALALGVPLCWLLYKQKRLQLIVPILGIVTLLYIGSYASYFWQGHSFVDWLQTQKWIINFYLYSQAIKNPLIFFSTIITGVSSWKDTWQTVAEWTLLWPLIFGSLLFLPFNQKLLGPEKIVVQIGLLLFGIFLTVPFAVRYLLLVLPLGIIGLVISVRRLPKTMVWVVVVSCLIQSGMYLLTSPDREITRLNQLLSAHRFDDFYFETTKPVASWSEFSLPAHRFMQDIKASKSTFIVSRVSKSMVDPKIQLSATYETPIGLITFQKIGTLVSIKGKWKLEWDWEFIAPHFKPTATVTYTHGEEVGGTLTTADGKNISKGTILPFITVIPKNIIDEPQLLVDIKTITGVDSLATRTMIHVDHPYELDSRIGFVIPAYDKFIYTKLATNSAVLITPESAPESRQYPQGAIDKKYVPIIRDLENLHPELTHYIQGSITLNTSGQQYTIYTSPSNLPTDVTLPQTVDELFGIDAQIVF